MLLFRTIGSTQKMPKGMEKALAAQEKAKIASEKSGRANPNKRQLTTNYRPRLIERNEEMHRKINEKINQSYSTMNKNSVPTKNESN